MSLESIKEFRTNFYNIYNNEVVPALKDLEQERLKFKKQVEVCNKQIYIAIAILIGINVLFFVFMANIFKSYFLTIFHSGFFSIVSVMIAANVVRIFKLIKKKTLESTLKSRIMPLTMKAFGDFEWKNSSVIDIDTIYSSKLFNRHKTPVIEATDDNFIGTYKNVLIKISEPFSPDAKIAKAKNIFSGVFIELESVKNFSGHTIIQPITNRNMVYPEIKLEDVEFSKQFHVTSTDQVEARYLLTPAFMQRYKNIQQAFGADPISCSFLNNNVLFAIPIYKDLFSLGDLDKPITDAIQFNTFLNEIISIFEMIEELKLYENTGL